MAGELDFAKEEAAVGARMLAEFGIASGVRASLGHVSYRVPGEPDKFVVKGRGQLGRRPAGVAAVQRGEDPQLHL